METVAAFILWIFFNGAWLPMAAFPSPNLCYAASERNVTDPTVCLLLGSEPWEFQPFRTEGNRPNLPRLEEQI